ncbi:MAG TPA: SDR family oxidoreductase [Acidimicrobiia bacterium]
MTGSTRGIGNAIARCLAAQGARVAVHGRDGRAADAAARDISGAIGVAGEISDPHAVAALCAHTRARLGPIDIVVNNAGTSTRNFFLDSSDEEWNRLLAVNLLAPRNVLRETVPDMQRNGWGRILNVTSEAGVRGSAGFSAYSASKGALVAFSLTLALELARSGICVNAFAPVALTDLVRSQVTPRMLDDLVARGLPTIEECAEAALPLVSDDAPNGEVVIMHLGDQSTEVLAGQPTP